MKDFNLIGMGGGVVLGVVMGTIRSGKLLPQVTDLDLWTAAGVLVADAFIEEHLHPVGQEIANGMGGYAAGYMGQRLTEKFLFNTTSNGTTTSSNSTATVNVGTSIPSNQVYSSVPTSSSTSSSRTSGTVSSLSTTY